MTGQIVQEIVNVIDATICQENLNLFGSIFGAQVFEYSDTEQLCKLYGTANKTCDTLSGPRTPEVVGCNVVPPYLH